MSYIDKKLYILKQKNDYKDYSKSNYYQEPIRSIYQNIPKTVFNSKRENFEEDHKSLIFKEVENGILLIEHKNELENNLKTENEKEILLEEEIEKINNLEGQNQDEIENKILVLENQIPILKLELDNNEDNLEEINNLINEKKESNTIIKNKFQEIVDLSNKKTNDMEILMKKKIQDLERYKFETNNKIKNKREYINGLLEKNKNDHNLKIKNISEKYNNIYNKKIQLESELKGLTEKNNYLTQELEKNKINAREDEENNLNKEFFIKKQFLFSKENRLLEEINNLDKKNDEINEQFLQIQENELKLENEFEDKKSELLVELDNKKYEHEDNLAIIESNKFENKKLLKEIEILNKEIYLLKSDIRKINSENKREASLIKNSDNRDILELKRKIKIIKDDNIDLQNEFENKKIQNEELKRKFKNTNDKIKYNLTHNIDKTINSYKDNYNNYN